MSRYEEKNSSVDDKKFGEPHPDCRSNFSIWEDIYKHEFFRKNLYKINANVYEFFLFDNTQVSYHRFKPEFVDINGQHYRPIDDEGVPDPKPGNPTNRKMPDWYLQAAPTCVQISFSVKNQHNCTTLNFHQTTKTFSEECTYKLKYQWDSFNGVKKA